MRKSMMIVMTTLALAGTASGLAIAHGQGDNDGERHERHQEKRLERMSEALDLTEEQQAQVKELMAGPSEHSANRDAQRELHRQLRDLNTTAADYNARLDALILQAQEQLGEQIRERQAKRAAMQDILTDAQEEKLAEMGEKRMEKMEGRGHHGRHGDGHHQGW